MKRSKYKHLSIHEDLIKLIDQYIEESPKGYRSRAEFVTEAIRRMIDT